MKLANAVLICAALLADSTAAAARGGGLQSDDANNVVLRRLRVLPGLNSTLGASSQSHDSSTSLISATDSASLPLSSSSSPSSSAADAASSPPGNLRLGGDFVMPPHIGPLTPVAAQPSADPSQTVSTPSHDASNSDGTRPAAGNDTASTPTAGNRASMDAPHQTPFSNATSTCPDSDGGSDCSSGSPTNSVAESMATEFTVPVESAVVLESEPRQCTPFPRDKPLIVYTIIYTSTSTFFGNPADYHPTFDTIKTPDYCTVIHSSTPTAAAPILTKQNFLLGNSSVLASMNSTPPTMTTPTPTSDSNITPIIIFQDTASSSLLHGTGLPILHIHSLTAKLPPTPSVSVPVQVFQVTAKYPTVEFAASPTPDFSPNFVSMPPSFDLADHKTVQHEEEPTPAEALPAGSSPTPKLDPADSVKRPPMTTYSVVAGANAVVINGQTFAGLQPGQTSTVTVGQGTFTVLPTAVEGMGSTILKPSPQQTAPPTPTSQVVGGVPVLVSGSQAVIGGNTVQIPLRTTSTTSIGGHEITLAPGMVALGGDSMTFEPPASRFTNEIVAGAEPITAIGKTLVVIDSSTLTYGSGIPDVTTAVGGELITIASDGVKFRGSTVGGPTANPTATDLDVVGGVTVADLPNSHVLLNGHTVDISALDASSTTTMIDGETFTLNKRGVIVSDTTIAYPTPLSVTGTIEGTTTSNGIDALPTETSRARVAKAHQTQQTGNSYPTSKAHDNSAVSRRVGMSIAIPCLFAMGVAHLIR